MIIDYRVRWTRSVRMIKDRDATIAALEAELREAQADNDDLLSYAIGDGIEAAKTHLIKKQRELIRKLKSETGASGGLINTGETS